MKQFRPLAVVLSDDCLDLYVISHRLGYQLIGFEHVFHTDVQTDDTVGEKECWIPFQQEAGECAEDTDVPGREIRSKLKNDTTADVREADELSENSSDSDDDDGHEEGESDGGSGDGEVDGDTADEEEDVKDSSPRVAEVLRESAENQQRSALRTHGGQVHQDSPASRLFQERPDLGEVADELMVDSQAPVALSPPHNTVHTGSPSLDVDMSPLRHFPLACTVEESPEALQCPTAGVMTVTPESAIAAGYSHMTDATEESAGGISPLPGLSMPLSFHESDSPLSFHECDSGNW